MTTLVTTLGSTNPVPMVFATCKPKNKKANKIEKCCPQYRPVWFQHTGRDNRGNRVGSVVEAVKKIKKQRYPNRDNDKNDVWVQIMNIQVQCLL